MNILSALLRQTSNTSSDKRTTPRGFFTMANWILTSSHSTNLIRWGEAVTKTPDTDPSYLLLRTLIFANAPEILRDITNSSTQDVAYYLYGDLGEMPAHTLSSLEFADWADSINEKENKMEKEKKTEKDVRVSVHSSSLYLLAQYLRGDIHNTRSLLFAILHRTWKRLDYDQMIALRITTTLFHSYLYYIAGWVKGCYPSTYNGIDVQVRDALSGRYISPLTLSQEEWDSGMDAKYGGSNYFGMCGAVPDSDRRRFGLKPTHTGTITFGVPPHIASESVGDFHSYDDCGTYTFTRFGNNAIAISVDMVGQPTGKTFHYFLAIYDKSYWDAMVHFFDDEFQFPMAVDEDNGLDKTPATMSIFEDTYTSDIEARMSFELKEVATSENERKNAIHDLMNKAEVAIDYDGLERGDDEWKQAEKTSRDTLGENANVVKWMWKRVLDKYEPICETTDEASDVSVD